ncbi:hypothetical protein VP01_928g1 [Puccinia sorghi]|uniref:Uncharacterized protein n=1 Tax=Puccinia sorghi TaxID=27349 RepID=A0A0L6U7J3_9BASI|nr:hypothetical protein VP01_928g1 [Puccinia sorghi]
MCTTSSNFRPEIQVHISDEGSCQFLKKKSDIWGSHSEAEIDRLFNVKISAQYPEEGARLDQRANDVRRLHKKYFDGNNKKEWEFELFVIVDFSLIRNVSGEKDVTLTVSWGMKSLGYESLSTHSTCPWKLPSCMCCTCDRSLSWVNTAFDSYLGLHGDAAPCWHGGRHVPECITAHGRLSGKLSSVMPHRASQHQPIFFLLLPVTSKIAMGWHPSIATPRKRGTDHSPGLSCEHNKIMPSLGCSGTSQWGHTFYMHHPKPRNWETHFSFHLKHQITDLEWIFFSLILEPSVHILEKKAMHVLHRQQQLEEKGAAMRGFDDEVMLSESSHVTHVKHPGEVTAKNSLRCTMLGDEWLWLDDNVVDTSSYDKTLREAEPQSNMILFEAIAYTKKVATFFSIQHTLFKEDVKDFLLDLFLGGNGVMIASMPNLVPTKHCESSQDKKRKGIMRRRKKEVISEPSNAVEEEANRFLILRNMGMSARELFELSDRRHG